ncbi:MAG: Gfo/Idh/MocA family protein [bacterium]|jgi:predicted dehydrogenase
MKQQNQNKTANTFTRRSFLQRSGLLGAALALPQIIPARVLGREGGVAASERVTMGFIGLGTMGDGHLFGRAWTYLPGGYIARRDVQVLAVCDVWKNKREQFKELINQHYADQAEKGSYKSCESYTDFRELLQRDDIDAVLIATPIHWHATMTVLAAQAGKDVYCEKPTAVTMNESKAMLKAVQENNRIFQAGTQQRSEYEGKFRKACEYVRSGRIGELKEVYIYREGGGITWDIPPAEPVPVPEGLDWDLWLGPAPEMPYQGRHDAHLFGTGGINWGQHHYDILQWALDTDRTGPVELFMDQGVAAYRYANGVVAYGRRYQDNPIGETGGGWFIGTEGKIGVDREHLVSDPPEILEKPLGDDDVHLYQSDSHSGNFLECIKTRRQPICDSETAHRAASVLLLGSVVQQLNRPLQWDPQKEQFIDDDEANELLDLPKREPWKI